MKNLLSTLIKDNPEVVFTEGKDFHWSPKKQQITFNPHLVSTEHGRWTLIHELGHAKLNHQSYQSDLELLQMEVAAWEQAKQISKQYQLEISEDHIQNCLDTYRDWLYLRSKCPACNAHSLQTDARHYKCLNCTHTWSVSSSRFCRPYRRSERKKTSPSHNEKAMFL